MRGEKPYLAGFNLWARPANRGLLMVEGRVDPPTRVRPIRLRVRREVMAPEVSTWSGALGVDYVIDYVAEAGVRQPQSYL